MSGGYTPLFQSLTTGTLYGRWPDIGLWPIVLSLSDRHGIVDVTPHYLAGVTGLPVDDVIACMKRFCEPDPYSRSKEEGGARLALIDAHRDWGWKIINHGKYREKARKAAFDAERVASGVNAERMRLHPRSPAMTRDHPPSDSDTNTDSNKEPKRESASRLPAEFGLTPKRQEVAEREGLNPQRTMDAFRDHWMAANTPSAVKRDWDAAWRTWCRKEGDFKAPRSQPRQTSEARMAWDRLLASDGAERNQGAQAALDAIGGWQAIRMRTPYEEPKLIAKFCEAYEAAA